ncbi:MAG: hypothetical protein ACLFOY_10265 [Desulfatibacillaceae bacterium]
MPVNLRIQNNLSKAKQSGNLVRIERELADIDLDWAEGFVLDYNEDFVLVHRMDDRVLMDGYEILRTLDLYEVENPAPNQEFKEKALELRGQGRRHPDGVDMTSHKTILQSVCEHYPLVVLYRELEDPDVCEIGRVRAAGDHSCFLDEIDPDAKWREDVFELPYFEITRMCFDGAYEQALAMVAGMYPWSGKKNR